MSYGVNLKLKDIFTNIITDNEYNKLSSEIDRNIFESYYIIGELLNPNNAYEYYNHNTINNMWCFTDDHSGEFFVRLVYQPTTKPYFEIKMGWLDVDDKNDIYKRSSKREIDSRRSDTVAKIYKNEILKSFIDVSNKLNCNELKIKPLDIKRYQFSIRLINKFTDMNIFDIDESNKPHEIVIKRKK